MTNNSATEIDDANIYCSGDGLYQFRATYSITRKPLRRHIASWLRTQWLAVLAVTASVGSVLLGVVEIVDKLYPLGTTMGNYAIGSYTCGLVCAIGWSIDRYLSVVPPGLEGLPRHCCKIAHLQMPLWEVKLAAKLLDLHVVRNSTELARILEGSRFEPVQSVMTEIKDYQDWAAARLQSMERLCDVFRHLVIGRLMTAIFSGDGEDVDRAIAIRREVDEVGSFTDSVVKFELEARRVVPPGILISMQQYQYDWSEPIRIGIKQAVDHIKKCAEQNVDSINSLDHPIIVLESPSRLEMWSNELGLITNQM